jgi:hypothetical protein
MKRGKRENTVEKLKTKKKKKKGKVVNNGDDDTTLKSVKTMTEASNAVFRTLITVEERS